MHFGVRVPVQCSSIKLLSHYPPGDQICSPSVPKYHDWVAGTLTVTLSEAPPPVISTGQMAVTPCGWVTKAGVVRVWVVGKNCVIPLFNTGHLSALDILIIKRYINSSVSTFYLSTYIFLIKSYTKYT